MTLNLDTIPSALREKQIRIGRGFPSSNTLEQADETLQALALYGSYLAAEGFTTADGERLAAARDLLIAAGVTRETVRGQRKSTRKAMATSLREAKAKRLRARTILENTKSELEQRADPASAEAVRMIEGALLQTRSVGTDSESLATQLDVLQDVLGQAVVSQEAQERGGAKVMEELTAATGALRGTRQKNSKRRGTVAETERLDLIDGIIVDFVRRARRAARSAARQMGQPAIAKAFELDFLYGGTGRGTAEDDTEEPGSMKGAAVDEGAKLKQSEADKPNPAPASIPSESPKASASPA